MCIEIFIHLFTICKLELLKKNWWTMETDGGKDLEDVLADKNDE